MTPKIWHTFPTVSKINKDWLIQQLAKNRGLTSHQKLKEFLNPKLEDILKIKLTDTKVAIARISEAINRKEKIIVYSDYDADGLSATAIMWETLTDLGAQVMPYVPHRVKEGYGLSTGAIDGLSAQGVSLIITVDHGVTAVKQVEHAKKLGVDIVITDHHVLPQIPPKSYALVHSTDLCGAGVAWRLAWELANQLKGEIRDKMLSRLELAAIATVADLVPLLAANRAIVKLGLEKISKSTRPGIIALMKATGMSGPVGTYEIGHIIAPRINAMGRIEHGLDALRLLCAKNNKQAEEMAKFLTKTNSRRQDLTTQAISLAMEMVMDNQPLGVIAHSDWHEGVIGLVASRLVESFNKPMIVISKGEIFSKGSARSIAGFNIVEAIRASSELLVDAGGHPMAAGFTIKTKHIEVFRNQINAYAKERLTDELLTPTLNIECELETSDINQKTLETIKIFEPFGIGNPQPIFLTKNMLIEDVRAVGQGANHIKLQVDGFSAIGFNLGERQTDFRPGYKVDLLYNIAEDKYNGNDSLQLKIKDLKVAN